MASGTVYEAVKTYLAGAWASTPIAWENENFDVGSSAFIVVEIAGTFYGPMSIGGGGNKQNRFDEEGVLYVHVMVPTGTGSVTARTYAKAIADLFRGAQLLNDSLEFIDASIGLGEMADEEGKFYRITVSIDWRRIDA